MSSPIKKANVCQYWVDEPNVCSYWTEYSDGWFCGFPIEQGQSAPEKFPYCNGIGTAYACDKYTSATPGTTWRCILPDPERNAGKRTYQGGVHWQVDWINGYNNGSCDNNGTSTLCSGYSPYIMGFSTISPDNYDGGIITADDGEYSVVPYGLSPRLPFYYEVVNLRSHISRCHWWNGSSSKFSVSVQGDSVKVGNVTSLCSYTNDEAIQTYWNSHKFNKQLNMWVPPCNGCKPECPHYTGICWEYCIDDKMRMGDKITAEQILELRYHLKGSGWTAQEYNDAFYNPIITAWDGTLRTQATQLGIDIQLIDVHKVSLNDFNSFSTTSEGTTIMAGTPDNAFTGGYPDLVKALGDDILPPVIKSRFDTIDTIGDDGPSKDINIFETGDINHTKISVVGSTFYYNSTPFAINLSDPDISLSIFDNILNSNGSMSSIRYRLEGQKAGSFTTWYDDFASVLESFINVYPNKIFRSSMDNKSNGFVIDIDTYWGDNKIIVFDKGSGTYDFDIIDIKKIFTSGLIAQNTFRITGVGTVDMLPAYSSNFGAYSNQNGDIGFTFIPLTTSPTGNSSILSYVYNDAVRKRLPATSAILPEFETYIVNYKLYKCSFCYELELGFEDGNFFILSNTGYILCNIPDAEGKITDVIKPWEFDGKIYLVYDDKRVEMEVVMKCVSSLPVNQCILKPKNVNEYTSVCAGTKLVLPSIIYYEKRSFGQDPTDAGEEIPDTYVGEDDVVIYRGASHQLTSIGNNFFLTRFGYDPLIISAVIRGVTGRVVAHVKTKMIMWVRQPYCRDVEIYYSWKNVYNEYKLLPDFYCHGPVGILFTLDPADNKKILTITNSYTPYCGDHSVGLMSGNGPMYYPYDSCESSARYEINGILTENDTNIMEIFYEKNEDGNALHGAWDMRMLGPAKEFGHTCETHARIWACTCDWSFCNQKAINKDQLFSGYARYRGGMNAYDKYQSTYNAGILPKFGNVYRDFLQSYRSIDNIDYYVFSDLNNTFIRKSKWVPANEFYTDLDMYNSSSNYPYLMYSSNDYYNDKSCFANPFGLFLAKNIEQINISETMDITNRFRFDDVFDTHYTLAGIYYPWPKNTYYKMVGGKPTPIITWYTYKDHGDPTKSIQWAWREKWALANRKTEVNSSAVTYKSGTSTTIYEQLPTNIISKFYNEGPDGLVGTLSFINISYPSYRYDYTIREYTVVCDEGAHNISIYQTDNKWYMKLDNGPPRQFTPSGQWVTETNIYNSCSGDDWAQDVTLYVEGSSNIPNEERTILTYDGEGEEVKMYFNRGLNVEFNTNEIINLPYKLELGSPAPCEVCFWAQPNHSNEQWSTIIPGEYYPTTTQTSYNVDFYVSVGGSRTASFDFNVHRPGMAIGFMYGASKEIYGITGEERDFLYSIPKITIFASNDNINWTQLYSTDTASLPNRDKVLSATEKFKVIDLYSMGDFTTYSYCRVVLDLTHNESDISLAGYDTKSYNKYIHKIKLCTVAMYAAKYTNAKEYFTTSERKYYVSYGGHGTFPPHGYENTGSLLYVMDYDRSTVYQMDSIYGVVGMPNSADACTTMNKVRGRIMKATHADKELVPFSDVLLMEAEQKRIHDDIAIREGSTIIDFKGADLSALPSMWKDLGISLPSWTCRFENSLVRPLTEIIPRKPYAPYGHKFDWDFAGVTKTSPCAPGRISADVYEYIFINAYTGSVLGTSVDAIVAYYGGVVSRTLIDPALSLASSFQLANIMSDTYRSQANTQQMNMDSEVVPLY